MASNKYLRINEYTNLFQNLLKELYNDKLFNAINNLMYGFNVNDCDMLKNELLLEIKYDVKHICFVNNDDLDKVQTYNNLKNICGINICNIFNKIKIVSSDVEMCPLVFFKFEKKYNCGYKYKIPSISQSYENLSINFEFDKPFKFKVCKFEDEECFYILIFVDMLNDENCVFENYDVVNINEYLLDKNEPDLT